jgi:leucyl aminopeptidase
LGAGKGLSFDGSSKVLQKYGEFQYRDMAGAAVIVAVMKALASLQVPINVTGMMF